LRREKQRADWSMQHEGHFWSRAYGSVASGTESKNDAGRDEQDREIWVVVGPFRPNLIVILERSLQTCFSGTFNTQE
jgi:hypothetical protein